MRIGVDIDEVLCPLLKPYLEWYNQRRGTSFREEDFPHYDVWQVLGESKEEALTTFREFYREKARSLEPFPEARAALTTLKEAGHELIIVTGRHNEARTYTPWWVEEHFPNIFSAIHYVSYRSWDGGCDNKAKLCKREGISVLIEDDPSYVEQCEQEGVRIILLAKPWNKSVTPEKGVRCDSWEAVVRLLENHT